MQEEILLVSFFGLFFATLALFVRIAWPPKRVRTRIWGAIKFPVLASLFVFAGVIGFCVGVAILPAALLAVGVAKLGGR
jgi:hypothetical protein